MDNKLHRFVAVDFVDDVNVRGYSYWYLCEVADVAVGDRVVAPLGRHNNLQQGIVKRVIMETRENSPFRFDYIKSIKEKVINSEAANVQNS